MDYYFCSAEDLRQEISRRGYFLPVGGQDELSEELKKDDESRGTDATTIKTIDSALFNTHQKLRISPLLALPGVVHPSFLLGERITHWTLDTFFPTLQLFFESGLSCTLEGGHRQCARVGLDQHLRFRLTDLTHEEGGFVAKSTLPQKQNGPPKSIKIMEATIAERTSLAVQSLPLGTTNGTGRPPSRPSSRPSAELRTETHVVIGLRLEGMQKMGYVWAKLDNPAPSSNGRTWHDVNIVGLRNDVPVPFVVFPQRNSKMGSRVNIVRKDSMIANQFGMNGINGINGIKTNGMVNGDHSWGF